MEELATTFDARFSVPNAVATKSEETRRILEAAELFWISTIRSDGNLMLLRSLRFGSMTPSTSSHRRHRAEGGGQPGPKLARNSDDWLQPLGHRNSLARSRV